jgi:hypothetical protein
MRRSPQANWESVFVDRYGVDAKLMIAGGCGEYQTADFHCHSIAALALGAPPAPAPDRLLKSCDVKLAEVTGY